MRSIWTGNLNLVNAVLHTGQGKCSFFVSPGLVNTSRTFGHLRRFRSHSIPGAVISGEGAGLFVDDTRAGQRLAFTIKDVAVNVGQVEALSV
jgi:hypothetical protein